VLGLAQVDRGVAERRPGASVVDGAPEVVGVGVGDQDRVDRRRIDSSGRQLRLDPAESRPAMAARARVDAGASG
jgi:hypothetical protein